MGYGSCCRMAMSRGWTGPPPSIVGMTGRNGVLYCSLYISHHSYHNSHAARHDRKERRLVLLLVRQCQRAHGAAVEARREGDDLMRGGLGAIIGVNAGPERGDGGAVLVPS